jgi:Xaa-Pro aminopeptidase
MRRRDAHGAGSGKFSEPQRAVYQIVRAAQAAGERQAKLGANARLMSDSATAVLAAGLTKLGLIESPTATYDCAVGDTRAVPAVPPVLHARLGTRHRPRECTIPDQFYLTKTIAPGSAFTIEPGHLRARARCWRDARSTPGNREIAAKLRAAVNTYKNIGGRIETTTRHDKASSDLARAREIDGVEARCAALR